MLTKQSNMDSTQRRKPCMIKKNKIPWEDLTLRRFPPKPLKPGVARDIYAFDTETLNGYVKVLACSDNAYVEPYSVENLLSFLTRKNYRDSINFFYNISYDFDSIVKSFDKESLKTLVETGKLTYGAYDISYIPKKVFTIKVKKNTFNYYDLFQFYEMSLEKASKLYVQGVKNEDNLDRALIGSSEAYWREYHDLIVKYCLKDCELTEALGRLLQEEIWNSCGFYPKAYVSKAGLSKRYFREYCSMPFIRDTPNYANYYAFEAYHGGRFEVTERGKVGYCSNLDICSAYPYQIKKLIDLRKGVWKRTNYLNEDAYYGFYLARVDIPYQYMPPLAYNWGETVIYPCGSWTAYFTKEELEALEGIGKYEVISGAEFWPWEIVYPFAEAIDLLYKRKSETPKTDFKYALYKKIMNSFYGSMYEKIKMLDGKYQTGICFNPVYATIITANTRLQLWYKAREYGKKCISLATDGLLIKGDLDNENTKELGTWELDKAGEATILRSGIYSVGDEIKQRGVINEKFFRTPYGNYENLFDFIREKPELKSYPILNVRPVHLAEAIKHDKKYTKEDINVFKESEVAFDLNTELKRVYDSWDITGYDLLNKNFKSMPHFVEEGVL